MWSCAEISEMDTTLNAQWVSLDPWLHLTSLNQKYPEISGPSTLKKPCNSFPILCQSCAHLWFLYILSYGTRVVYEWLYFTMNHLCTTYYIKKLSYVPSGRAVTGGGGAQGGVTASGGHSPGILDALIEAVCILNW